MKFEVKNRFTGEVRFTAEIDCAEDAPVSIKLGLAVKWAVKTGADLADAYLADANLARANLADANLARAYLARANLADANLADAYLARAYLADANLADAYLARAYLADANLARAYLARAYLARANLADANLADAYLARANLARANLADARNLPSGIDQADPPEPYVRKPSAEVYAERAARFRERNPDVPVIPDIDARILALVEANPSALDMGLWHSCETTHCRAGWAVHLAGEAGYALEKQYGPERAGRMIYLASTGRVPHFYATNERALEDIRECAASQANTHLKQ